MAGVDNMESQQFGIHPDWPFNMLRVRDQHGQVVFQIPSTSFAEWSRISVDDDDGTRWMLAPSTIEQLQASFVSIAEPIPPQLYIVKVYEGYLTLLRSHTPDNMGVDQLSSFEKKPLYCIFRHCKNFDLIQLQLAHKCIYLQVVQYLTSAERIADQKQKFWRRTAANIKTNLHHDLLKYGVGVGVVVFDCADTYCAMTNRAIEDIDLFDCEGERVDHQGTLTSLVPRAQVSLTVKPKTKAVKVLGEAEILHQLNSLGPLLERMGAAPLQMVPLISSMLQMAFSHLSLELQLTVAAVSRHWLDAAMGYVTSLQRPPSDNTLAHTSWQLALAHTADMKDRQQRWSKMRMPKDKARRRHYGMASTKYGKMETKVPPCCMVPVSLNITDSAANESRDTRRGYMKMLKALSAGSSNSSEQHGEQQWPRAGSDGFVALCESPALRELTIELFREQFSPDMHAVFPLLCNSKKGFGLDFSACKTWLVFGQELDPVEPPTANEQVSLHMEHGPPVGAVTWRIHEPLSHANTADDTDACPVVEVLFISVDETKRSRRYGSALVEAIEAEVRRQYGTALLYVEIAQDQNKARQFWSMNGLKQATTNIELKGRKVGFQGDGCITIRHASQQQVSHKMVRFFENRCLRFADTAQWVKHIT